MRDNSIDRTIERNYVQKWRFLIAEYEVVKAGRSAAFSRVRRGLSPHAVASDGKRLERGRALA
jgi:hypothetical protein